MLKLKPFKTFWKLPRSEKALGLEAFFYLLKARLMILLLPFRKIAPRIGEHMKETPKENQPQHSPILRDIRNAIRRVSRRTPWESACLVQSIAAKMMLKRRNITYTLYLGLAKDNGNNKENNKEKDMEKDLVNGNQNQNALKAHAWLRSGDVILTGNDGVNLSVFTVISMFAGESR
ncbi:MAG: lasso peptide biosynthesis B2 protein [bacterium]|nr:lasso peptide biosynthesis B2 protein [bacterium]